MKNHKKWIIVDLDGTICDCAHRLDMAKDGRWEDFHAACKDDVPFPAIVSLVATLAATGHSLFYLSGRDESQRLPTIDWFTRHSVPQPDIMRLRPSGDFRKDGELKTDHLNTFFGSQEDGYCPVGIRPQPPRPGPYERVSQPVASASGRFIMTAWTS